MTTFRKATFDAAIYASARPTYPRQLYDFVFQYHERGATARWDLALDLGCGTGQATHELTPFKRVIGVDPSARMIERANQDIKESGLFDQGRLQFIQSPAESLSFVGDGSVDLMVSAQAAHWFDWKMLWTESARVLRKDGTLAAWGYSEFRVTDCPDATPLIHQYAQGTDPENSLGPHWERPGRTIVDNHYLDIPHPSEVVPGKFSDFERVFFSGDHHPSLPSPRPVILRKTTTWAGLMAYLRSSSSLHNFHERYPTDLERPDGDIAVRFLRRLKEAVAKKQGKEGQELRDEEEVVIEWPLALILARKA
ncbi:hypothetical protein SCP_0605420 [Sparassis crispa]|uniref:Methyltransferase type 11 domain-containing protein n=1 Tax=Sparassis crispa TaxID=139825 RepID=A0A401GQS1_9APHY|nr:hypothetical protein SCP_0605420 [Sparassis crispa]GBE84563.1 hypothetical protein SCP_0605420 [Sparassis crispa]